MTGLVAYGVHAAGTWAAADEIDSVVLDYDQRHRRRLRLTTAGGQYVLLDLPRARRLRDDDGLQTGAGIIRVVAAAEQVMDIFAPPAALIRIAWHLGNRHLPVQLREDSLRVRHDHVIASMIAGLGGHVHELHASFDPEEGAYAQAGHGHAHDHSHG